MCASCLTREAHAWRTAEAAKAGPTSFSRSLSASRSFLHSSGPPSSRTTALRQDAPPRRHHSRRAPVRPTPPPPRSPDSLSNALVGRPSGAASSSRGTLSGSLARQRPPPHARQRSHRVSMAHALGEGLADLDARPRHRSSRRAIHRVSGNFGEGEEGAHRRHLDPQEVRKVRRYSDRYCIRQLSLQLSVAQQPAPVSRHAPVAPAPRPRCPPRRCALCRPPA